MDKGEVITEVPRDVLDVVYGSADEDWHQHSNGKGWVYKTAYVAESAYLHNTSVVSGNARVYGNAQISGNARVSGNAQISGNARISGNAQISGEARVHGKAQVYGDAWVIPVPYILGSRHALTLCSLSQIAIGCHVHDIADWRERYRVIGRAEGYTEDQIEEYGEHIAYLEKIAQRIKGAKNV